MSQQQEVWVAEECVVTLQEIIAGVIQSTVVAVLYAHDVRAIAQRKTMVKQQPGCAYEERRSVVIGYEISVGRLCYEKATQITPLLDKTKQWRLLIQATNPRYTGTARLNNEWDYRYAVPISGPDLEWGGDSGELQTPVTFFAPWAA